MKSLKMNIPMILLILFEAAVGIFLLRDPETFTKVVVTLFGIILLTIGVTYLIRYLRARKEGINDALAMLIAVVTLAIGAVCTFASGAVIGLLAAVAVIYGVVLIICGIYKLQNYFLMKKAEFPVSALSMISGVLAILLGVIVVAYPKDAAFSVWQLAGIVLIVEAVMDLVSLIRTAGLHKDME